MRERCTATATSGAPRRHATARLRIPAAAPVRTRDDLQKVPIRVLEIETAAAIVTIDVALLGLRRIGPILLTSIADAFEYGLEFRLADQEGIVLRGDVRPGVKEIDVGI